MTAAASTIASVADSRRPRLLARRPMVVASTVLLGAMAWLLAGSPTLSWLAVIVALIVNREWADASCRRHRRERLEQLPDIVDELIQRLRSGETLTTARQAVAPRLPIPDHPDRPGRPARGAAETERPSTAGAEALSRAVVLIDASVAAALHSGGPAVEGLQRLRYTIVGLVQAERRVLAESAQALASALLLAGAPALFIVGAAVLNPPLATFYLHHRTGLVCVMVATALVYGGWRWMRIVVGAAARPRRGDRTRIELAPTVDLLAVSLGAGRSLHEAVAEVARLGPEPVRAGFGAVVGACHEGRTLADALPLLVDELGPAYQSLTSALVVGAQGGAPLAVLLQRLADDAESARRFQAELRSKRTPVALLPPLTLCMLPAIIVGALVPLAIVTLGDLDL